MRFMPTETEVKVLRQYERERRPMDGLTVEDRFMMIFSKIERLPQRMTIMAFMGNFSDSMLMLTPVRLVDVRRPGIQGNSRAKKWRTNWLLIFTNLCYNAFFSVNLQQLHAIIAASVSIKSSQKLKKILEVRQTNIIISFFIVFLIINL